MHELGIVTEVVEIVREKTNDARITRLSLEIGRLSTILPDAVRFAFDVATEGTPLEGAELHIIEVDGTARCRACSSVITLARPIGRCSCGGFDLEWLTGTSVRILSLEEEAR
jgi:hydrogenase nickel incorporation protein HypA/HybF